MTPSIASIVVVSALAGAAWPVAAAEYSSGEADPAQSRAAPSTPTSKADREAARKVRRAEGAAAAHDMQPDDQPNSMGAARSSTPEERKAAAAKRRAETAEALKRGEIPEGEK